ncbi:MAG: SH3 domain-containing protein [Clostridia bacterium]|nr:SH3 domain-containing protein [Clostridia bacterium]
MNFPKSRPNFASRVTALVLSAGFLAFFPGCALRDQNVVPAVRAESPDLGEMLTGFAHDTIPGAPMPAEPADSPAPQPELNAVLAQPERPVSPGAEEWITRSGEKARDVILTDAEIDALNAKIAENCPTVVDIANPPATMEGSAVREMIRKYSMPAGDRFTRNGEYIDASKRQKIETRRAADSVPEIVTVKKAVITNRCDLKGVPTSIGFHAYGDRHYSGIQETELITGFPVWILHESSDGAFVFVQSYYYAGWIPSEFAALCTDEEFSAFANPGQYVTVTATSVDVNGTRLDMGAALPYVSEDETGFTVSVPVRDESGNLTLADGNLAKTDAVYGSLPYTMENYYNQAFAFLGTPYGWGGSDGGVDCSGFVCAVFRCFGIYLPRNTGEQSRYNGEIVNLAGLTAEQKHAAFSSLDIPSSVHWAGHVMLYLGEKNGAHYVIHAPQGGEVVSVMQLNLYSTFICAAKIH